MRTSLVVSVHAWPVLPCLMINYIQFKGHSVQAERLLFCPQLLYKDLINVSISSYGMAG